MADERYEWLDQAAAERLLRGEPVEPVGVDARSEAHRLAELLDGARVQGIGAEPLRGEDAALAAFRKARDGGAAELLPTVHLTTEPRPVPWVRSVRWGLAASLAGLMVGGVAVAAGAGVLPAPFGGDNGPQPASSVSAPVDPGPLASKSPADDSGTSQPPAPPASPGTPSAPPSPGDASGGPRDGTSAGAGQGESAGPRDDAQGRDEHNRDWYRRTADACRDYRNGTLDEERRRRLETAARGADRVKRFCDRVLSSDGKGDDFNGGDSGDGKGDGDSGGGDDGDDGPAGGGGSGPGGVPHFPAMPPAGVRPAPVNPVPAPSITVRPVPWPSVSAPSPSAPSLSASSVSTSLAAVTGGLLAFPATAPF
ncbi:hypothetical protein [Streptomyces sp. NPDC059881]|uniref:hypothetical protein n=1 Tax=Streptomyces sp. NPDC059881 TaxID=3346986 RepID=UPI003667A2A2